MWSMHLKMCAQKLNVKYLKTEGVHSKLLQIMSLKYYASTIVNACRVFEYKYITNNRSKSQLTWPLANAHSYAFWKDKQ